MRNRLVIVLAGLSLGVLAACGEVRLEEPSQAQREPVQVDPATNTPFCYACPIEAMGGVTGMNTRVPVADAKTGELYCPICDDGGGGGSCGDGVCGYGESCGSCSYDCGSCTYCGDGFCNGGESCGSCQSDCGSCTWCGDGTCNGGETSASCPGDCGSPTSGPVLGRFSRWCGKVNVHTNASGGWDSDADCTSGCNIGGLAYCQKFWPDSIGIRQVAVSAKANNVWDNAGCQEVIDDYNGSDEFECIGAPRVVGRISRWCGKVNIHTNASGGWNWDADCTSGCNIGGLAYCQKFWPNTTSIRAVSVSSKPNNVWANAGCAAIIDDYDGSDEFECVVD